MVVAALVFLLVALLRLCCWWLLPLPSVGAGCPCSPSVVVVVASFHLEGI